MNACNMCLPSITALRSPQDVDEEELTAEEAKERKIMKLLLKVKNGTPPQRKSALRQLTDKARDLGAGPLFNQILPLLMSPTLEDQERHLLVKVRMALRMHIQRPLTVACVAVSRWLLLSTVGLSQHAGSVTVTSMPSPCRAIVSVQQRCCCSANYRCMQGLIGLMLPAAGH